MRFATFHIVFVAWISLIGCSSVNVVVNSSTVMPLTHQPESDSVQRTVGLLRRLLILPPRIEFFPSDPKNCIEDCGWETLTSHIVEGVTSYLSERRGYEVVLPELLLHPDQVAVDPVANLDEFVQQLAVFAEQRSSEPPSEDLAVTVRMLGKKAWADGLVVIKGNVTALTWVEAWLAFPLALSGYGILAAIPIEMVRLGSKIEADIFETQTGKLIWASVYSSGGNPFAGALSASLMAELLDPIEPALPAVMTRTIAPPTD